MRWPSEVVRHKALDLIGDLALLGRLSAGRIHLDQERAQAPRRRDPRAARRGARIGGTGLMALHLQTEFDIRSIMMILPHRYPMLLIDRIIEFEPMRRAVGYKNFTVNESSSKATFPESAPVARRLHDRGARPIGRHDRHGPARLKRQTPF